MALVAGALLLALPIGGCSTSIADLPLIGTPADAPARPKQVGAYPAVHDLPQDRPEAAMDAAPKVASLMMQELGFDEAWKSQQLSAFESVARHFQTPRA